MRKLKINTPTLEEVKEEFLTDCKYRGLAQTTLNAYHHNIRYFNSYLIECDCELSDISSRVINAYKIYLMENTNRNVISINTVLRHVSTYLKWLYENDYIDNLIKVKYVKGQAEPKEIYSDSQIKRLLRKPKDNSYASYRSWAIVNVLVSTGIRRTSLINIKLQDVDWHNNVIRLTHTKNKQVHYVNMSNDLARVIKEWLKYRIGNNEYLFTTQTGTQLMASSLTNNIYRYCRGRGVNVTSVHCFRHYFAVKFMQVNGNIFQLSKALGHSSIAITQNYLKSIDNLTYTKQHQFNVFEYLN